MKNAALVLLGLFVFSSRKFKTVNSWSLSRSTIEPRPGYVALPKSRGINPLQRSNLFRDSKSCTTRLQLSDSTSIPDEDTTKVIEITSLSPSQIVELIELSFLQSCLALSKGNIEPLQLFIVAVRTASKQECSVIKILGALKEKPTERPLDSGEENLRSTWIQAIYLLLAHMGDHTIPTNDIDPVIVNTYSPILDDLVAIQTSGLGLNIETFVERRKDVLFPDALAVNPLLVEQDQIDPIQFAIVSQTIKLLYFTLLMDTGDDDDDDYNDETKVGRSLSSAEEGESKPTKVPRRTNKSDGGGRGFG